MYGYQYADTYYRRMAFRYVPDSARLLNYCLDTTRRIEKFTIIITSDYQAGEE